ncbi:hypothetical protein CKA32_000170 [Geitlerinema sp. FC II]|nr:hypothetical protein CKA32_000170 [Geitlerinema sp. FC II]
MFDLGLRRQNPLLVNGCVRSPASWRCRGSGEFGVPPYILISSSHHLPVGAVRDNL